MSGSLRIDGDGSGAVKVFTDMERSVAALDKALGGVVKEAGAVEKATDKLGKAAEGAGKSQRQMILEAQKIREAIEPQERLNRKLAELQQHVDAGRLSMGQAIATGIKMRQEFAAGTEEAKRAAAEEAAAAAKKVAAIKEMMDAQEVAAKRERQNADARAAAAKRAIAASQQEVEAKKQLLAQGERIKQSLENPTERYKRQVLELGKALRQGAIDKDTFIRGVRQYKSELEDAGEATRTFGEGVASKLAAVAGGYMGISAAVGFVTQALQTAEQQAQRTADASFQSFAAAADLQNMSENPEQFKALLEESRQLVKRGIVAPNEESKAYSTVANLQNAGYTPEEREALFRPAARGQIADIQGFGGNVRTAQDLFGEGDTGDVKATIDKLMVAAGATLENATETAQVVPKFGSEAKAIGVDFERATAAYIAVRKQSANADRTADRLKAFFSQVDSRGLNQGDLYKTVDFIDQQIKGGKTAQDMLGDVNAVAGYRALSSEQGRRDYSKWFGKIEGAPGTSDRQVFIDSDPRSISNALKKTAEGDLGYTQSKLDAERETLFDAYKANRLKIIGQNQGGSGFWTGAADYGLEWADSWNMENWKFKRMLENEASGMDTGLDRTEVDLGGGKTVNLLEGIRDYMERQTVLLEELNGKRRSGAAANMRTVPARP